MSKSSVAYNTAAQLIGKVATLLLGLATTSIIFRTLGTTEYGAYVFVTSFVLFFAIISDWGTEIITLREISQNLINQQKIVISSLIIRLSLSFVAVFLANVSIRLYPQWQVFVGPVTLLSLVLIALALKISAQPLFLARGTALFGAIGEVINNSLYFLAILMFLPRFPSLMLTISFLIISTLIAGLICWAFVSRLISLKLAFSKNVARSIVKEALPTGALLAVFYIYNRVDIVILQNLKGNDVVGLYGIAYKIHDNLVQGAAFLMNAVFPLIAVQSSTKSLRIIYQRAFHVLFIAALFLFAVIFIAGPSIINLIGGPSAAPAIPLLRILILATVFAYLNHLTGYTLIALGHQRASLIIALTALSVNISGNLILIPLFSATAASFMTLATEALVFLLSSFALYKYTDLLPSFRKISETVYLSLKTRGRIFENIP